MSSGGSSGSISNLSACSEQKPSSGGITPFTLSNVYTQDSRIKTKKYVKKNLNLCMYKWKICTYVLKKVKVLGS